MGSSIPGATKYWLNLATTTLAASTDTPNNSTPYVWFGKSLGKFIAPVTLQVMSIIDIKHDWAELGSLYKVEESYKIRNQLVSYAGDIDYLSRMTEVFENFLMLTIALAADYTLGNNIRLCLPAVSGEVIPSPGTNGSSMCTLTFDIHCEARIQSIS
jgi:hypothetical protein